MANKKQLVAIAKNLGLDADLTWKKSEIQEAIDRAEAEIAELEAEKTTDDETEEEPVEPVIDEPVDTAPEPTPTPEPASEPKPEPELAVIKEPVVPSPVAPPPPAPEPKAIPGTYKCLTGLTWQGKVYDIGDTVVMDDESAKVHVRDKAIGPVDAIQAKAERAKMLPAGDYKLICDLTLDGKVCKMNSTISLTADQANLYEKIDAIEPR